MRIIKTETLEQAQEIESAICQNCGLPNGMGTEKWDDVKEFPCGGFYISAPPEAGWAGFTFDQMMAGVNAEVLEWEKPVDEIDEI